MLMEKKVSKVSLSPLAICRGHFTDAHREGPSGDGSFPQLRRRRDQSPGRPGSWGLQKLEERASDLTGDPEAGQRTARRPQAGLFPART